MGVEEILTLVKAGFNADQIQAMIPQPQPQSHSQVEIKTEPEPDPKKEDAKVEEPKAEPETKTEPETSDLEAIKAELAEAKKQVTSLQTLLGSHDNSGGAARQTPEEYLSNIFKNFY